MRLLGYCDATDIDDLHNEMFCAEPGMEELMQFVQEGNSYRVEIAVESNEEMDFAQAVFDEWMGL